MFSTLVHTRPTAVAIVSPDFAAVCLFSLLGLTLSAAVLSCVPTETINIVVTSIG